MAHELTPGSRARSLETWLIDAAFLGLLLLAFVGMQPFAIRNPATDLEMGPYTATGGGDWVRQALLCAGVPVDRRLCALPHGLGVRARPCRPC